MDSWLEDLARKLVGLDTVSDRSNLEAIGLLADRLDSLGFRIAQQRFETQGAAKANLVASIGPPVGEGLIVSGHVDTVPYSGQPGWVRDPLALEIADDRVYGRGTSDMKVFLAQCVEAARHLDPGHLARPLVFVFTADEEIGCLGAARLVGELRGLLGETPLPALAWIGEPTSWSVFHAHKGIGVFRIRVRGRGGHSGIPALGVNAIAVAGKVLGVLNEVAAELRSRTSGRFSAIFPDAPYTTLNPGTIHGGTATNVIAEECTLAVSLRTLPDQDPGEVCAEIEERLRRIDPRDSEASSHRATIEIDEPVLVPPMLSPRGTSLERALSAALGGEGGGGAPFAADGCRLAGLGISSILCGPGEITEAHQPNESIPRVAFESGAGVILSVVRTLCGRRAGQSGTSSP